MTENQTDPRRHTEGPQIESGDSGNSTTVSPGGNMAADCAQCEALVDIFDEWIGELEIYRINDDAERQAAFAEFINLGQQFGNRDPELLPRLMRLGDRIQQLCIAQNAEAAQ